MKLAEPFTLFVDRSLGGSFVAKALREAGQHVVAHDDEFEPNARDVDWLRVVGKRGWVVLTKDARIRTNGLEREALLSANVAAFGPETFWPCAHPRVGGLGPVWRHVRSRGRAQPVTTPPPDVIATYTRLRQTQRALNTRMVKTLSRKAIEESAKHLGFFRDGRLLADTESDLDLVVDSAIYDYYPAGNRNAVARFASQHMVDGDERIVLDAMSRSRFTLVELGDSVEGVGVHARDLVFQERFFLADVALSRTAIAGLVLATRLLAFDSFSMTTGVHIVIDESVASLVGRSWDRLAGRAKDVQPREASFLARFFLKLGMIDPEDARILLADVAASQLPRNDPRREAYRRLRAERARIEQEE